MLKLVNSLSRSQKWAFLLCVDLVLVLVAQLLTLTAFSNSPPTLAMLSDISLLIAFQILAGIPIAMWLGIPKIQLKAYETRALGKTAIFGVLLVVVNVALGRISHQDIPLGNSLVFGLIFVVLSASSKMVMLQALLALHRRAQPRCRVLIYGAGTTGMQLASALKTHEWIEVVAFVDDNPAMQSMTVAGLPVLRPVKIKSIIEEKEINRVLLAMPSLSPPKLAQIVRKMQKLGVEVQVLPSFAQLVGEEALVDKLTPVVPANFLGRAQLDHQFGTGGRTYRGKTILVSGAGGSIGSELCRQLLLCRPARLVLFEMSEAALYTVDMELRTLAEDSKTEITPVLGSTTDPRMARKVLGEHRPDVVFHAAAYKHVPLVEANPLAGLANNVLGTRTIAEAAREAGVDRFILISSDKAVRPTNVMGASKRLAELVVQDLAMRSDSTSFSMVRFGNVIGSSGSVVPLFHDQISKGGPVTLTHEDVTRYFMTIREAVQLVLLAGSFERGRGEGGDVFVLDMGKPVKIRDLALQMIEASGYTLRDKNNPDGDIEIVSIGLRPGEKMHEELLIGEGLLTTPHPKILRAKEAWLSEIEVAGALRALRQAVAAGDEGAAREVVSRWVEGYVPPDAARGS
ncbi:MAG: nucleotide sugar epimerase [Confluentimicrobium sp.]|uniref:polysaccharide biosynthesis protein n=1 Tax=Actibacterium sp. TaxID=1872125 RepID=UPI000C4CBE92|nr:nucleoside-diphosphate sugar epimerase/dehydratase [Actibacterium sp.]MBC57371.1 nucleotide sugar epimerase [Actibacterium sp.]